MSHYLVVAHGDAARAELPSLLGRLVADDPGAVLTLLVTATYRLRSITGHTPELEAATLAWAIEARETLRRHDIYLVAARAGDGVPSVAVADELRAYPDTYDAIVFCTDPPRGVRAWFRGDQRTKLEASAGLPVLHLYTGVENPWGRARRYRSARLERLWERTKFTSPARGESPVPTRRQMVPIFVVIGLYLLGGLILALTVDRRFLFNDALALPLYAAIIGGVLLMLRIES